MDKDRILAMQPGRELDALVAEKVMGWVDLWTDGKSYMAYPPHEQKMPVGEAERDPIWPYSTDIAAAWEVFHKVKTMLFSKRKKFMENLQWIVSKNNPPVGVPDWEAGLIEYSDLWWFVEPADICKAALLTVID